MASSDRCVRGHDKTALDEIELAGELMIAASASEEERLAPEEIDEVLLDRPADEDCPADGHCPADRA